MLKSEVLAVKMVRPLAGGKNAAIIVGTVAETYLYKGLPRNYTSTVCMVTALP